MATVEYVRIPEFDAYIARVYQASGFRVLDIRVAVSPGGTCAKSKTNREAGAWYAYAHAHNYQTDPEFGLICVRSGHVRNADGSLHKTMWHELAHLLTPNQWHTKAWKATMVELGQPVPAPRQRRKPSHYYRVYCWDRAEKRGRGDYLVYEQAGTVAIYCEAMNGGRLFFYAEREWNVSERAQRTSIHWLKQNPPNAT